MSQVTLTVAASAAPWNTGSATIRSTFTIAIVPAAASPSAPEIRPI